MKRFLILLTLIILALICYTRGFAIGGGFFLILGAIFELGFWVGIFNYGKKKPKH
ncbi:hypothetical protein [Thalassotalea agarivorans]|uniref:Uncharacterized protein n=1 Tax=Thalassotalea agarivorans TaxID=349064 RepID=A0A1I0HLB4_THASX|nr:hypothetical protein [Thalassotalea agarivorans]SET83870.1 hypothetical protein SAMN05660429_02834 [Thalassotalea agarivorans]